MVLIIDVSFTFKKSTEKAGVIHRLLTACISRSVSVKLLYDPAAMSNVLYHSPFFTFADLGPYMVFKADAVLKDSVFGAIRTIGPVVCQR